MALEAGVMLIAHVMPGCTPVHYRPKPAAAYDPDSLFESLTDSCRLDVRFAIPVCIAGVCLIARPGMETDQRKAHLHLAGIIVGLFQAFFSGAALYDMRAPDAQLLRIRRHPAAAFWLAWEQQH